MAAGMKRGWPATIRTGDPSKDALALPRVRARGQSTPAPIAMMLIVLTTCPLAGCERSEASFLDSGTDFVPADASLPPSDTPVSLAVDFAIEGCPSFDPIALTCTGHVPLAVRFVPLATTTVTKYLWDFGDGFRYSEATTPEHAYDTPGVYSVTIIATGMGGGLVTKTRAGFIVAQANGPGQPCDVSAQCTPGHSCICGSESPCTTGPTRGLCASPCSAGFCGKGEVCARLSAGPPPAVPEPWQTDLCLGACTVDTDCMPGLQCRTLPPGPAGSAWVRGCFARVPVDVGEPCSDANGTLRDDLCVLGLCADLGALGTCTLDCQADPCPLGADCAVFGDGRKLCLRSCTGFACGEDSLLSCAHPGRLGDLGYQINPGGVGDPESAYCAPKPCNSDEACFPAGVCAIKLGNDGHCVRRP
jgi:PKD repeat protein